MFNARFSILWAYALFASALVGCQRDTKATVTADESSEVETELVSAKSTLEATTPKNAKASCVVSESELATWFQGGEIVKDGFVTTANSLEDLDNDCDFYKWSWRMFLWQTSRISGDLVFNSAPFFDLDDDNELISNKPGATTVKYLRGGKLESTDRTGQAGVVSGVLMAQSVGEQPDGSLVYYAIHVNDVLAYMASGVNSKELDGVEQFPITKEELATIVDYAKNAYGVEIKDGDSLAMELKSSWVKADDSIDATKYLRIKSDIPKYTRGSDKKWTWDGTSLEQDVTLVCVGYHLVGSVAGHPEMVWATFEHNQNAPDDNYYYVTDDGNVALHKNWSDENTPIEKDWLFMDGTSKKQTMNQMHMELQAHDILATPNQTISPSNTMRTHPWGNAPDKESAANNTDILSINRSIASSLAPGDVRANYFLVGATWTKNGVPGVGLQQPVVKGSLVLANTTMETYFQFKNCFDCHKDGKLNGLSHIFGGIKPLAKPDR